jgi:hypothetical protein
MIWGTNLQNKKCVLQFSWKYIIEDTNCRWGDSINTYVVTINFVDGRWTQGISGGRNVMVMALKL